MIQHNNYDLFNVSCGWRAVECIQYLLILPTMHRKVLPPFTHREMGSHKV